MGSTLCTRSLIKPALFSVRSSLYCEFKLKWPLCSLFPWKKWPFQSKFAVINEISIFKHARRPSCSPSRARASIVGECTSELLWKPMSCHPKSVGQRRSISSRQPPVAAGSAASAPWAGRASARRGACTHRQRA